MDHFLQARHFTRIWPALPKQLCHNSSVQAEEACKGANSTTSPSPLQAQTCSKKAARVPKHQQAKIMTSWSARRRQGPSPSRSPHPHTNMMNLRMCQRCISWLSTLGTFLNSLCFCGEVDSCLGLALAFFWLTSWSLFLVADVWDPCCLLGPCLALKRDSGWWCCLHPCMLLLPGRAVVAELLWQSRPNSCKHLACKKVVTFKMSLLMQALHFWLSGYTIPHSGLPALTSLLTFFWQCPGDGCEGRICLCGTI